MLDFENLGFEINVGEKSYNTAITRLDEIIKRLERIQRLEGKNGSSSKKGLTKDFEKWSKSGELSKRTSRRNIQQGNLNEYRVAQKNLQVQTQLGHAYYEQDRKIYLLNQNKKKLIDERLKQELGLVDKNTKGWSAYLAKITSVVVVARKLAHFMGSAIKESANYIENLNLFAVAYGDTYKQQLDWALGIAEAYGLANNEVIKFAGTFRELSISLGLVGETADLVSKTVTNLGYDLSALFNTSVENTMEKLQSGVFSGNVRPLRAYGIDISQNQIDALFETNEALKQLGVNARNLSQSDKVIARLIITLQSGKDSFGTMAREINNLQSQFRIFQGSLANFKLAIGDLVNKPLSEAMVYVNGFLIGITKLIRFIVPLQKEDKTPKTITNIAEGSEEASEELDKLQGKLAKFDKFNVLQQSSSSSSNLSVTEELNKLLEEQASLYENELSNALDNMTNKAEEASTASLIMGGSLVASLILWIIQAKKAKTASDLMSGGLKTNAMQMAKTQLVLKELSVGITTAVAGFMIFNGILNSLEPDAKKTTSWIMMIAGGFAMILGTILAIQGAIKGGVLGGLIGASIAGLGVGALIAGIKAQVQGNIQGFENGGYTNANLIMTHENGKREWVGKAAGSSAIVNDTQMSDIMEMAVAKGVYNALSARSDLNGGSTTEQPIVIKIGEEVVFRAVKSSAKKQGLGFTNI